jgi:hypothetical protein
VARTESPSQGYRLAAASLPCPGRSFGTYGRGDRRRTNGTAVVEGFPREQKSPHPHIPIGRSGSVCAETPCAAGTIPHTERSFFLYEKSVLRESDFLRGRKPEVCTDLTLPFSALKKALKKLRVPRGFNPLGGSSRAEPSRSCPSSTHRFRNPQHLELILISRAGQGGEKMIS